MIDWRNQVDAATITDLHRTLHECSLRHLSPRNESQEKAVTTIIALKQTNHGYWFAIEK
jgi:hypothetical protein